MEVFIDNFAVFSSREAHLGFLRETFQRCREMDLKLHPGKCFLDMTLDILLGHFVSKRGLEVDMKKVIAILALISPTCICEIWGFLGCIGYYRSSIDD